MAQLKYCDKHNQVGFLFKPAESAGYTEIVDFLRRSKLRYALTHNPPIYDSLVKQFWQTATARTLADGTQQLNATIDSIEYTITEESVRRKLQLADALGINMLQNDEIFAGLQNIGSKSGGWDQFGSNIATALICLSTGRDFNFSKLIFDGMIFKFNKAKSKGSFNDKKHVANQMITYLEHVANKKHAELKSKSFEEIQVLYERYKKQDQTFVAIGSEEDERAVKKMNEQAANKEKEQKAESVHEEMCLHIAPDEDKVIDVEILDHQYPIVEWKSFYFTTKPQYDPTKPLEDAYLNMVTRSNGNKRFFRTLMGVLSIFDREDLKAVYELVMEKYQDEIPEGFDKMLWGDLIIMFNQGDTADFWDEQLNWKIISWKLHSSSGVHTIMTSNGLVIHMLVENRYPLTKEVLSQLLDLKLETEEDSTMALELIKFVKQQLEEFEDSDDDDLAKSDHEEAERSKRLAGKELSNPFIADDLLKIIWLSMYHGLTNLNIGYQDWSAMKTTIKTRFGGNANSKKMQKAVLKQQFEAFTISSKESLEKGYDRFQKLLSQFDEPLFAGVSDKDSNHKFLRSLLLRGDNIPKDIIFFPTSDNVAFLSQAKASSSKHKPSTLKVINLYYLFRLQSNNTATPGLADEFIQSF
ncbi:hypothetical protein Tco_1174479 [Tanacetum coccineum]